MSRPTQSLLVLAEDSANLGAIATALRAVPGVSEVRSGTFHREHAGEKPIDVFVEQVSEPNR